LAHQQLAVPSLFSLSLWFFVYLAFFVYPNEVDQLTLVKGLAHQQQAALAQAVSVAVCCHISPISSFLTIVIVGFGAATSGGFGAPAAGGFGAPASGGFGAAGGFGAPAAGGFGAGGFGAAGAAGQRMFPPFPSLRLFFLLLRPSLSPSPPVARNTAVSKPHSGAGQRIFANSL
jgi:hypothetical protein